MSANNVDVTVDHQAVEITLSSNCFSEIAKIAVMLALSMARTKAHATTSAAVKPSSGTWPLDNVVRGRILGERCFGCLEDNPALVFEPGMNVLIIFASYIK